tara:strand:+ start:714 stop:977 length:264 start_codon:yes stop_codon:yes gene_type:complete
MIYQNEKKLEPLIAAQKIVNELMGEGFGGMPEHMTAYSWAVNSQTGHDISVNDEFSLADQKKVNRHVMRLWAKEHDLDDDWRQEWRV